MTRLRKTGLILTALFCALMLGFGLASCGGKETTPAYGYGEEGTYYYTASDGSEYLLSLQKGTAIQSYDGGGSTASYAYDPDEDLFVFTEDGEDMASGSLSEAGLTVTYNGRSYLFLTYEYYTVSFSDGSSTITTQSVLNGKAATDPGEPEKDGYVFLGWYADSDFTTRYEFNTSVTSDTTIYARFVELTGTTEYKVTYDFGNGETLEGETLNGKIYDLPEAEKSGYTFIGWWVSATNQADELTYRYEGETLYEDTTLFAVYASGSYIGASIKDGTLTWLSAPASQMTITVADGYGNEYEYDVQTTSASFAVPALSETGKYALTISCGGVTETLVYVSNGLSRASGFTVISGSILMYSAVENAERYYISIDCGNPAHDHTIIDNGTSLYYDFSSCEMPATGITFTVYAYAEGYYYSVSSYNYFLGLERAEVTVEGSLISWTTVSMAMSYEIYIDGTLVATTSDTSYSLSGYGTGTYEIAVRPVTTGYYSEMSETVTFTKTTLASPEITGIDDYTITWTPVEGATGYTVSINGTETTVGGGDITSLILSDENYTEGLDEYEISVKALASDSANDSPYGETVTVTGTSVGSAVSYNNGTVTWQYSLSASEYRITVNDGDELIVTGTNSTAITLTKSGNNEITIYFVNDYDEIYGTASVTVYAYAIVFDARGGGTMYMNGEEVEAVYVAKGDTITLPEIDFGLVTVDFLGWYTLPDVTDDPDADDYGGDGTLFEDGTVFTGNSTMVLYAAWLNPRMLVTLDPGMGTLTDEDGAPLEETYIRLNGEKFTIAVPECDDGAYAFVGWYSGPDGEGKRYTDETGYAYNPFANENVTKLYAYWAEVLSFELTASTYDGSDTLAVSAGPEIDEVETVTIPEAYAPDGTEYGVTEMTGNAFMSCTNLRTINVPDTMRFIDIANNGYDAGCGVFEGTALENVNVYATGEPSTTKEITYYSDDGVLFRRNASTSETELLYYPYGRTDASYAVPECVSNENELELDGGSETQAVRYVDAIGASVFASHACLVSVTISEGVVSIGPNAFQDCVSLETVSVPSTVSVIGDYAFDGCSSLTSVEIPEGVTEIGACTFRDCVSLVSITIPSTVESIGSQAFYRCYRLAEVINLSALDITLGSEDYGYVARYAVTVRTSLGGSRVIYSGDFVFLDDDGSYYLVGYDGSDAHVVLPDDIEGHAYAINGYAFYEDTSLESIVLSDGITRIGDYCFYGCSSLASVTFGSSLVYIGGRAFYDCASLAEAVLPSTLRYIGEQAFRGCTGLVTLSLSEGLEEIDDQAFYGCSSLTDFYIPSTVRSIGSYAFRECTSLTVGDVTEGVEEIGTGLYYGCTSLRTAIIPSTVSSVPGYCFYGCSALEDVLILDGPSSVGNYAFRDCVSLRSIEIPSSVEEIGDYCFYEDFGLTVLTLNEGLVTIGGYICLNCSSLISLDVPSTVTTIGNYAFQGCTSMNELILREGLEEIGQYAFNSCRCITSVTIPSTVTSIGTRAFYDCNKLVEVEDLSELGIASGSASANGYIMTYAINVYTATEGESHLLYEGDFKYIHEDGVYYMIAYLGTDTAPAFPASVDGEPYEMYKYLFYENGSLKSVVIPEGVTAIGQYAFYGCTALETVVIPATVASIGNYAFSGCTALTGLTLTEGVNASMGSNVFNGCTALTSLYIPSSQETIGSNAFEYCSALSDLTISEGVTTINTYAFAYCTSLTELVLPEGFSSMGTYAFAYCYNLLSVTIPSTLPSVGSNGFRNDYRLVEIYNKSSSISITKGATGNGYIGQYAKNVYTPDSGASRLTYADSLAFIYDDDGEWFLVSYLGTDTDLILPDAIEGNAYAVNGYAFYENESLESVAIPEGVTGIGDYAFDGCPSLGGVVIPDSVAEIGQYAFDGCSSMSSLTIGAGVTSIGNYAFRNCKSLTEIHFNASAMGDLKSSNYVFDYVGQDTDGTAVYIGANVTEIPNYLFYPYNSASHAPNITSVTFEDGSVCESIGQYAFGRLSMTSVILPDTVTTINNYAFYTCSSLEWIVMGGAVTTIGNHAFNNCSKLSAVYFGGSEDDWDAISVGSSNSALTGASRYYYSEEEPPMDDNKSYYLGDWWHWVDGKPEIWVMD